VLEAFADYAERQLAVGVPLSAMTRHVLGLFNGRPGARAWRRHVSENSHQRQAGPEVLLAAAPGAS
jgi:tRNA-dihydrouridine synthase A